MSAMLCAFTYVGSVTGVPITSMSPNKIGLVLGVLVASTLLHGLACIGRSGRMKGMLHIGTARLLDKYEGE
jgi:hypothetical protein